MTGLLEAARGLFWARRRQPDDVAYLVSLAHERFTPSELWTVSERSVNPPRRPPSSWHIAGREPGGVIVQLMASWADSDHDALESSRAWKASRPE